jgi:electron transfer flavoprotein beta subunit
MAGTVVACLKHVALRVRVDPLTGDVSAEPHATGMSDADRAALEWALRLGEHWGRDVVAVTAGPAAAAGVLRTALAAGASRAVRADLPVDAASDSVAAALAAAVPDGEVWLCGDHSLDRGSGSAPAFLAAQVDAAQALGLVYLEPAGDGVLTAERRLDGARRERLRVPAPAVLSVESATARLRRAPLPALVDTRAADIAVTPAPSAVRREPAGHVRPFRPRARSLPGPDPALPARERLLVLTGALSERTPPRLVTAGPEEAADELVRFLRDTGYLT